MKIIKFKLIFVLGILVSSCGFKIMNQETNDLVYLQNINVSGERRAAYMLKNNLLLISSDNSSNKYDVQIEIIKQKKDKIKNKAGKVTRYTMSVIANLKLTNLNNNKIVNKVFLRNSDFNVAKIHSETINNEMNVTENIVGALSEDIINFIILRLRN